MEMITINGKSYKAKDVDYNFICELEDANVQIEEIEKNKFKTARCYAAYCMGMSLEKAGKEISEQAKIDHDLNVLNDIYDVFMKKMEIDGFFPALNQNSQTSEEKNTETSTKKTRKTAQ